MCKDFERQNTKDKRQSQKRKKIQKTKDKAKREKRQKTKEEDRCNGRGRKDWFH